jgi:hypothetical protein
LLVVVEELQETEPEAVVLEGFVLARQLKLIPELLTPLP